MEHIIDFQKAQIDALKRRIEELELQIKHKNDLIDLQDAEMEVLTNQIIENGY